MIRRSFSIASLLAILLIACGSGGNDRPAEASGLIGRGEMLYGTHCVMCHGEDGTLGVVNASDLSVSRLSREEMIMIVTNGRGTMMAYRNVLSKDEIEAVVDHVLNTVKSE